MHIVNTKNFNLRTDLVMDNNANYKKEFTKEGVSLYVTEYNNFNYSTITFIDATDNTQNKIIKEILTKELKKYLKDVEKILIIGLGNRRSTPDALGPKSLDQILVTRHLFSLGDVEDGYKNVSIFEPSVLGNTGISSVDMIKEIVDIVKPDCTILIDSLCTSNTSRLNSTIQITDKGINPGSGVLNDRGELSEKTLNTKTIAIGVPTVIDLDSLITNTLKSHNINNLEIEDNLIVTPKEIDYIIEKISMIIGDSINKALHTINKPDNN